MKNILVLLAVCLLAAGCSRERVGTQSQNASCVPIVIKSNDGYGRLYDRVASTEATFIGTLSANPEEKEASILQHYLPYSMNGMHIFAYSDLNPYLGKSITVQGKLNNFELEGQMLAEIWPKAMCVQTSGVSEMSGS